MNPRFVVGIDLGTTNSTLAWVDAEEQGDAVRVHDHDVTQLVGPGEPERRSAAAVVSLSSGSARFSSGHPRAAVGSDSRLRSSASSRDGGAPRIPRGWSPPRSRGCRTAARTARRRSCPGARLTRSRTLSPVEASRRVSAASGGDVRRRRRARARGACAGAAGRARSRCRRRSTKRRAS